MPLSKNPEARRKQLANLTPSAARTHGAQAEDVEPLAEKHAQRLRSQFKTPDPELLRELAVWAAIEERTIAWIAKHDLFKRSPKGDPYGAVTLLLRAKAGFERLYLVMLEQDREARNGKSGDAIRAIEVELDDDAA